MTGKHWLGAFVIVAAMLVGSRTASAQWASCTISATPISFGVYNVFSPSDLVSTGSISFSCTGFSWTMSVYLSKGSGSSNNPRQLVSGSNRINYNLYMDASHTQIWGDPNPNSYSRTWAFNANDTLTVYGLIPAGQDVRVGSYTDLVVATINF